jgi:hypothetical protein
VRGDALLHHRDRSLGCFPGGDVGGDRKTRKKRSKTVDKLIEGTFTQGWSEALGVLVLNYPDRIGPYLNR